MCEALDLRARLLALYDALYAHFGHEPHWWPIVSDTPQLEVIVGAVLVQQTRWETVEAAVVRLRAAGLLSVAGLAGATTDTLAALLRPCAFYNQKAPGLQAICRHILDRHGGDVGAMLGQPRRPLRAELLALPRIGRETADAIMLYAGGHPVFVVDAYTRRLFARLDLVPGFDFERARYDQIQELIEGALLGDHRPATTDHRPPTTDVMGSAHRAELGARYPHLDGSLRHFLWDLHALITEECIHHCLERHPRHHQAGARRRFVDERKCAAHCLDCQGCPLVDRCAYYARLHGAPATTPPAA